MHVLVIAASKHGATEEIGQAIASTLRSTGIDCTVSESASGLELGTFDAYVIGSGIYAGHWLTDALEAVNDVAAVRRDKPVWLFSSGPIGEPPVPKPETIKVDDLVAKTAAIEHRVFGGELDRRELGFGERLITKVVRAKDGDFRDWDEIRAWAESIAVALQARAGTF